jgi:hypothetical protein
MAAFSIDAQVTNVVKVVVGELTAAARMVEVAADRIDTPQLVRPSVCSELTSSSSLVSVKTSRCSVA